LYKNASKENIPELNPLEDKNLQIKKNEDDDDRKNAKKQENLKKVNFLMENH